jgi:hypothetical protein
MAIELNDNARPSAPVLRNQRIGELAQVAIIKTEQRDRLAKNKITQQLEKIPNGLGRDGQPKFKQELVIHGIVMPGTDMQVKQGDDFITPEPGARVRLILKGLAFGKLLEARRAHRGGRLNVGDVLTTGTDQAQAYDQDGNPKGQPIASQAEVDKIPRGQTVGFYGPISLSEPTDPAWVTRAEEAYLADQRAEQEAKAIPAAAPAAGRSWLDEEVGF